jgi:tRNA(Ile)-lysidine synthetase-like protein
MELAYTIEARDVPVCPSAQLSLEEAARQVRYGFLLEVALAQHSETIAVAHNADDQAESVLMHFLRGSGLSGLRGMLPKMHLEEYRLQQPESDVQHLESKIYLVRPFLETPRSAIEVYCQQHHLQPRVDATNADTTYFRNRLRHELADSGDVQPNIRSIRAAQRM